MIWFRQPVAKARRPKWKVTRTKARLMSLQHAMKSSVKVSFIDGIDKFKSRVNPEDVYQAWLSGHYDRIRQAVPFATMGDDMSSLDDAVSGGYIGFGNLGIKTLPAPVVNSLRYDVQNPRIDRFISVRTAELVTRIEKDTERVIQDAVRRSFTQALDPRRVADRIVGSIGLVPRDASAVQNMEAMLVQEGLSPERVSELTSAYEDRLLNSRALSIARTETAFAQNYGQLYVWQDAQSQGLLSRDSRKVWNTSDDPCAEVCAPMDGVDVGMAEAWTLSNGDIVDVPNEAHPNCECYMTIDLGSTESDFQEAPEYQHGYEEGE